MMADAMSFSIRAAATGDLPKINALMHGSSAYRGEYYKIIEGTAVSEMYLADNEVFVAERNGDVLGFYSLVVTSEPAELDLMFVSDDAQRSGIGRVLFEHMKDFARRCSHTTVMIGAHPPAVPFYERMGATRCGVSPPLPRVTWERPLLKLEILEERDALDA
jgi:GNAT superfamily N-acetyltransferase